MMEPSMALLSFRSSGTGKPVLLLHPVGLDGRFWDPLSARLSDSFRVVAVDLAGHGDSPPAARPGRMADRVADVVALIEHLGDGPAILVGLSFGGMIAQQVALARPDLVSALVVAGCGGRIGADARGAILKRGEDAEAGGMEAVVDTTLERWFNQSYLSTPEVARVRERLLSDSPSGWAAAWEAIAEHDALDRLGELDMPALVVAGENDLAIPLDAMRALAAAIPGSQLLILSGAPHMMQIESAVDFTAGVAGFLEQLPGRPD
ncbi:MAG: hypothetical protein CMJ42_09370 [Phyllobacteriaceae bacterium]|nr:hypothetical protein [Phyllobacteriaceae bacterium]MBA89977.1 hypothetical protein [Phyllobacteriaceae bacterium]